MKRTCKQSSSSCCGCSNNLVEDETVRSVPIAGGIPLAVTKGGDSGKIVRIAGKCELRRYLSNLGFVVGTDVSVVNTVSGDLLLDIKGTRIAMGRSMASKVFIVPEGF